MKKVYVILLLNFCLQFLVLGQEINDNSNSNSHIKFPENSSQRSYGVLLETIQLISQRSPLGVTVVGDKYIVTSSDGAGSNYFDTYNLDGTYISSVVQGTSTSYGYRDLAFDGTYILGSDSKYIDKIDPVDFKVVESIYNEDNSVHRGLAFDPNENVIYSTNFASGYLVKINATTGETIKKYKKPDESPYGIAFDNFRESGIASLWYNEPSSYGTLRISRVDTTFGNINFTFDFTSDIPDSALSGGLEIINDHPDYPDKIVGIAINQHSQQLLLTDLTDAPYIMPFSITKVGEFGGWDNEGIITSGIVQFADYMYAVNNGDLAIYNIATDPAVPALIKTITVGGGNKIFLYNNLLFVSSGTTNPNSFNIYDLTDPLNPSLLSTTDTGNPILDMEFNGDYAFVIQTAVSQIISYDISDLANPQLAGIYNLPAPGIDLEVNNNRNILFAGYFDGTGNSGYSMIDISDGTSLQELNAYSSLFDIPQRIKIIDDKFVFVLKDDANCRDAILTVYDYSDSTHLKYMDLMYVSFDTCAWDMKMINGTALITFPGIGVQTYKYEPDGNLILLGPKAEFEEGRDMMIYTPPVPDARDWQLIVFIYFLRGYAFDHNVVGSEPGQIFVLNPPIPPTSVDLTMLVDPAEAAADGCSTIPAPGVHSYSLNAQINVYALPSLVNGWYFTGWSGDASGTDLIAPLVMDRDKFVQANFDKLELTVSGSIGDYVYCPSIIEEKSTLLELPFLVCASDADGWDLSKISFTASGTGNDAADISSVKVFKSGNEVYSGNYSADNGTIDVTFSPPISIGPGQCVPFKLTYDFNYDVNTYAADETKSFHVQTFGVVAVPWNYEEGDIVGRASNDSLVIARVYNSAGEYFSKINDGVNSASTLSGDTCFVCKGEYNELIQNTDTTKAITVVSVEGKDVTSITPADDWDWVFLMHGTASKNIDGFTLNGAPGNMHQTKGIAIVSGNNCSVRNIVFNKMETGLSLNHASNTIVEKNSFIDCDNSVSLNRANNNEIYDNLYKDSAEPTPTIKLLYSNSNYIHYNRIYEISSDNSGMYIDLESSSYNRLRSHNALENSNRIRTIKLSKRSNGNEIFENTNFGLRLEQMCDSNSIHHNTFRKVIMLSSDVFNWFEYNTVKGSDSYGLNLIDSEFRGGLTDREGTIYIKHNNIFNNLGGGIYASRVGTNIMYNDIYNNGLGQQKNSGIVLFQVFLNGVILSNDIYDNGLHGVQILDSRDIYLENNNITGHNLGIPDEWGTTTGVLIHGFGDLRDGTNYVINNYIGDNCTGIEVINTDDVIIRQNTIDDSYCLNTGVHLEKSSAELTENNIRNNNGNGILCGENSLPVITNNNISGNSEYGLNNANPNGTVTANGNFWGSPDGPGTSGIFGTANVNDWLLEEVSLVAVAERDTVFASAGHDDSTTIHINDLTGNASNVVLTVNDNKDWIQDIIAQSISLSDSTGAANYIKFNIPEGTDENELSKVDFNVKTPNNGKEINGSFYISAYKPVPSKIIIPINKVTVMIGDIAQFTAEISDQFDKPISAVCQWTTTAGTIDSSGLFIAGNTTGECNIKASVDGYSLFAEASVYVANEEAVLSSIAINPDSVALNPYDNFHFTAEGINQFNYPMEFEPVWSAAGGMINEIGLFTADTISGTYFVILENSDGNFKDTAYVSINGATGIENETIPKEFVLFQNYPNPFNPTTTIKFGLKEASNVRLEVFNILGQKILTAVNSYLRAGNHSVDLNFAHFASGVYIYRIDVKGKFTDVKKMILVK